MSNLKDARLKVLFLASWYPNEDNPISGIFIKRHAQAVSKYCDVCVLYIHGSQHRKETGVKFSIEDGIKTVRVYYKKSSFTQRTLKDVGSHSLNCIRGLKAVKKEFGKPDIVHAHVIFPAGTLALLLNTFTGIPYVLTEHSGSFNTFYPNYFYKTLCQRILCRARKIMPVSNSLETQVRQIYQENKYIIVPNVVNTKDFTPNSSRKDTTSIKKILHVSLLNDKVKNVTGIINAVNDLSNRRTDFEMHIIGDGADKGKLENLASNLKILDKYIFFHGKMEEAKVQKFMKNSNFFILNSMHETFSIVCAEALSSGIPVISTRCGGPEEYINKDMGILIEPGNHDDLVNTMYYMLDNSTKYNSEKMHEYIEDRFSYNSVGLKLSKIYNSVVWGKE